MSLLNWKIYFFDGNEITTRTNLDTKTRSDGCLDLPILPVVLILNIRRDNNGARACMEHGRNYYCLVGSEFWASTFSGLINYLDFYRGRSAVLRGGHIPNDLFQNTYTTAKNDPEVAQVIAEWFERDPNEGFD